MIEEQEWSKAIDALQNSSEVVVACHIGPDGDALGSMLGLASFLEREGKRVWRTWGSGKIQVPFQYSSIPGIEKVVHYSETPESAEVFASIDCGSPNMLDLVFERLKSAKLSINIDHHVSNDHFGDINLVDSKASSSCEVAYGLIKRMGGTPTADEATSFYIGIVTDTGRFQYSNASPQTLRTAAELRELGVDHESVANDLFASSPFDYLRLLGVVASRATISDGVIWSVVEQADLEGLRLDDTDEVIDVLRSVREAKVAVMLKQLPDRRYKVSMRSSSDDIDVAKVAESFGGGGHKRAAGFRTRSTPEECIKAISQRLNSK